MYIIIFALQPLRVVVKAACPNNFLIGIQNSKRNIRSMIRGEDTFRKGLRLLGNCRDDLINH